jgi:hypothetical protein
VIRRPATSAVLLATAALALAGCGGGSSSGGAAGGSSTAPGGSSSGTTVQGVSLTDQGAALKLGEAATVSWQPAHHPTGVVKMSVTKVQKAPISAFDAWQLDPAIKKSTPYYVHAHVENVGSTSLAGVPVPLYLLDSTNTLRQASTFKAQFRTCPSTPLPAKFTHGHQASVCLVYFVPKHGSMTAVSFRPTPSFDAITWTGAVQKVAGTKASSKKASGKN